MKPLRVLIELQSPDTRIGAVNDALDLVHFVPPRDAEFHFCGNVDARLASLAGAAKVGIVPARSIALSRLGLPRYALDVARWVWRLLRLRPDVVHLNYTGYAPSLACAAVVCGIPVVARAGDYGGARRGLHWIRAFVANGEAHARALLDSPLSDRVFIAGDLFRPERLTPAVAERPLPPRDARPRFLFIGQLVRRKGIDVLLDAFARVRNDAELVLVGGDWNAPGYPAMLRATIRRLSLDGRVRLEDHRSDVGLLLEHCDVVVVPSRSEARPRTILEAMWMGRPVIATRVGGIPSLIADGVTGLLVPAEDAAALAVAIDRLAELPAERERLGGAARENARATLAPQIVADRYVQLYRALAAGGELPLAQAVA